MGEVCTGEALRGAVAAGLIVEKGLWVDQWAVEDTLPVVEIVRCVALVATCSIRTW